MLVSKSAPLVSKSAPLVEPLEKIKRSHSHRKVKTHKNSPINSHKNLILISNPDDHLKKKIFDILKDIHPLTDTELLRGVRPHTNDEKNNDGLLRSDIYTSMIKELVQSSHFKMPMFNNMLKNVKKYKNTNTYVIQFEFPIKLSIKGIKEIEKIEKIYPEYSITIDSDSQKENDKKNFDEAKSDGLFFGGKTRRQKGRKIRKIRTRKYQKNRRTQKKN